MGKLGGWLQVGANVGILVGLILVGAQMRQSNSITGAELFSDNLESTVAREFALLGETPELSMVRVMYEPETATRTDYFVADRVYGAIFRQFARAARLSEAGFYGTSEGINARGFVSVNHELFACPYGLAWLDRLIEIIPAGAGRDDLMFMRDLAARRSAVAVMDDRIGKMGAIRGQLNALSGS